MDVNTKLCNLVSILIQRGYKKEAKSVLAILKNAESKYISEEGHFKGKEGSGEKMG